MVKEKFDLTDRVALVIGGRGLLGRRSCAALAEFGARVYSADLREPSLAASKDTSASFSAAPNIEQRDVDVTDPISVAALVESVLAEASRIDTLVYSVTAKPQDFYKPLTECSLEGWQLVLRAELDGLFLVVQQVGRAMEQARKGSMIFFSSIYGIVGNDQRVYEGANLPELYAGVREPAKIYSHAVYAAAKGGVIALTRYLAAYWGEHNIRVNCISPGGMAHPGENEEFVKRYSSRVPLGRKADLDDVTGATIFLASDASAYVTGHNLVVDGGWTAW
jgi:NAD(P)-dependent dehydrogenase (short-subunit alcohol dehydrogenase family)